MIALLDLQAPRLLPVERPGPDPRAVLRSVRPSPQGGPHALEAPRLLPVERPRPDARAVLRCVGGSPQGGPPAF